MKESTVSVSTRVVVSMRDYLQTEATKGHRTISQQVAMILDAHAHSHQVHAERTETIVPIASGVPSQQCAPCAP